MIKKKKKLTLPQRRILTTPAGWVRGVVLNPEDGYFYPEQLEDINLPPEVLIYCKRKTRRCGWSHGLVWEAVAVSHLKKDITNIFVSMNLTDAYKKIEECKKCYHKIHPSARRPITVQNKTTIRFSHGHGAYSEIMAMFQPRGMPGRNIRLIIDEADHIVDLKETMQSAIPNIIQGDSRLKMGGSVYRDHGVFNDMFNLQFGDEYDDKTRKILERAFRRAEIYWWQVPWLLDPVARDDMKDTKTRAAVMETKARVLEFGSDRLKITYATMPKEDFQQEFELKACKEGMSLIPWDSILAVSSDPNYILAKNISPIQVWLARTNGTLVAGYDVGRRSNTSELTIFGYIEKSDMAVELFAETFEQKRLPAQTEYLRGLLTKLQTLKLFIDCGGIGMEMADALEDEFRPRVKPVYLEHYKKLGVLDSFANRIIRGRIKLAADAERRRQIHSIKRRISESGVITYYVPRKESHHADKAISQALAIYGINEGAISAPFVVFSGDTDGMGASKPNNELDELAGGHDDFVKDVINA